jgi:hypothetical protein
MSGIFGLFNQGGSPTIDAGMLRRSCVLARPEPDGTTIGPFGQAVLATRCLRQRSSAEPCFLLAMTLSARASPGGTER